MGTGKMVFSPSPLAFFVLLFESYFEKVRK
jgi:hypothetical protein